MDDEQNTVIAAVWRAGAKDYRDVEGKELNDELNRQAASIEEERLVRLMRALRDEGLIEMYVGGGGMVTDLHNIRLSSRGRQRVDELPEAGG